MRATVVFDSLWVQSLRVFQGLFTMSKKDKGLGMRDAVDFINSSPRSRSLDGSRKTGITKSKSLQWWNVHIK